MVNKLPDTFTGTGPVKGFVFNKEYEDEDFYVYRVSAHGTTHYELFKKKMSGICINFEKRIFSDTEFKHLLPYPEAFGQWAWTKHSIEDCMEKIKELKTTSDEKSNAI